jgi:hypothetical protein
LLKALSPKVTSTSEFISPGPSSQGPAPKMFLSTRLLPSQQLIWIVHVLSFQLENMVKSMAKGRIADVHEMNLQNKGKRKCIFTFE